MKIHRLPVVSLMLFAAHVLAGTEIIQLNYRMADELLPMAQSVVSNDGRIDAYGNQLIVNAPAAKLRELRELLEQLDTPPRRLLISVDSRGAKSGRQHGYAEDGSIGPSGVEIQSGRDHACAENQVCTLNRIIGSWSGTLQQIQTVEGYPALIQTGQSVPLHSTHVDTHGQVHRETYYRNSTYNIYVTARISGDIVHITFSSDNDRLDSLHPGLIDIQHLRTQASGHLGQWIDLGNTSGSRQNDHQGLLRQHSESSQEELLMRLKVEILK